MKLKATKGLAILAGVAVGLSLLTGSASAATKKPVNITVAELVVPQTFDPSASSQIATSYAWQLVFEGLVYAGVDGKVQPRLATSWTISPDETEYLFTLRNNVRFHNGAVLTPEDVVFTFERVLSQGLPFVKDRFRTLSKIEAVGSNQVRFTLTDPTVGFLLNLGSPYLFGAGILNKAWAQSNDPRTFMMGTGKFQMVSYVPNQTLTLKKNVRYWDRKNASTVDNLTIRYIPEQSAQLAGLTAGNIDLMFPSAETKAQLAGNKKIKTYSFTAVNTIRLNIGTGREPFNNVDVRRAISLALNREEIVKGAFLGEAVPSAQIPPAYSWAVPRKELTYQQYNPARAKELLAKAGYPNGFTLELNHYAGYATYLDRFAALVKSQLAAVGITVNIAANPVAVWLDAQNRGAYDLMTNEYAFQGDPLFYLMPRPGRQGPTPANLQKLIDSAQSGSVSSYFANLQRVQRLEDDIVFPDITVAARRVSVSWGSKIASARPDATQSRDFLARLKVTQK